MSKKKLNVEEAKPENNSVNVYEDNVAVVYKEPQTVNVLGTEYNIIYTNDYEKYPVLEVGDGSGAVIYCSKLIIISNVFVISAKGLESDYLKYIKKAVRHELFHAFIYESGLSSNSAFAENWANNEEMVDWLAIQSPKIYEAMKSLDVL